MVTRRSSERICQEYRCTVCGGRVHLTPIKGGRQFTVTVYHEPNCARWLWIQERHPGIVMRGNTP